MSSNLIMQSAAFSTPVVHLPDHKVGT